MNSLNSKIIIKVGKQSKLQFNSHVKIIRAITSEELNRLIESNDDCHLIIIEGIYSEELELTGEIINKFKGANSNNCVLFYSANDPVTSGLADSLNYDICTDLDELYTKIRKITGINASIFLKDKRGQLETIDSNDIFGTPENITDAEAMKNDIADTIHEIEKHDSDSEDIGDDASDLFGSSSAIGDNFAINEQSEETKVDNSKNSSADTARREYTQVDDINIDEMDDSNEDINKLITALANSKLVNNELREDVRKLSRRNSELEELVVTLTDKNDSLVDEYFNIVSSGDVFEDPITLSEYQALQESIKEFKDTNQGLKEQITDLKEKLKQREETVLNNLAEIGRVSFELDTLKNELDTLNIKIESGEIHSDIIADYESKLGEISLTNERLAGLYKDATEQNKRDGELISVLRQNLDIEVACRYKTVVLFKNIFKQIVKDKQAYEAMSLSEKEVKEKYDKLKETCEDLKEKLGESVASNVELKGSADKLGEQIKSLNEEKAKIEAERDAVKTDKATLEESIKILQSEKKTADEENDRLTAENSDLKAANEGFVGHITNLTNELNTSRMAVDAAEKLKGELDTKIESLNKEIEGYKLQISELSKVSDTLKQKETTIKEMEEKIGKLNGYLSDKAMLLQTKEAELKKVNSELSVKVSIISDKDKEIATLKESLDQSNKSLENLRDKLNKSAGAATAKDTQLSDLRTEVANLKKSVETKQAELAAATKTNSSLTNEIAKLNARISELESKVTELTENETAEKTRADKANEELKKVRKELSDEKAAHTATSDALETANTTIGVQKEQLATAKKAIEAKAGEVQESKSEFNDIKDELSTAQIELSTAQNTIKTNEAKFKTALAAKDNEHKKATEALNQTISEKDTLIDALNGKLAKANGERAKAVTAAKQKDGEIEKLKADLEIKADEVTQSNKRLEEERKRFKASIDALQAGSFNIDTNGDGTVSEDELNDANRKIRQLEHDLALAKSARAELEADIDKLRNSSGDLKKIKSLTESLAKMTEQNSQLTESNTQLEADYATANAELVRMKTEISGLKSMLISAQQRSTGESFEIKPIKYKGTAKIVPVFGSGSHGVTTAAMSVAQRLSGSTRVVYLDFDLVSPSADSWLRTNPIIKKYNMTAFNIFVEKGVQLIEDNIKDIILKIDKTKGGGFDYFSGLYDITHRFGEDSIANADFTGLFNMLSRHYDYIVVDLGTLGSSSLMDSIICNVSAITKCNIAVTTSDQFEIRNFGNKIESLAFTPTSVSWLINMCPTGNWPGVPQNMMNRYITKYKYAFLYDDPSIRGTREKFGTGNNRQNRETFDFFMMKSVFED